MGDAFNAEEILEIACQIERHGAMYYRRAAQPVDDPAAAEMLEELASMEDEHEIVFENMRGDPDTLSRLLGDPDGPAALYLQAIAGGRVFTPEKNPVNDLALGVTVAEVLRTAIGSELASIAYYEGLRAAVPPDLDQGRIEAIIREEMGHVVTLGARLSEIEGG